MSSIGASHVSLPKYQSPGSFPNYQGLDPWSLNTQAVNADQLLQNASNNQFASAYPALFGANQKYQQNVSDAQWDASNALANAQTMGTLGTNEATSRAGTAGVQQGREQGALGQLANTSTLGDLTAQRWGINQQGRSAEAAGLTGLTSLSSAGNQYKADPTYNALEKQGMAQTKDANYQNLVKTGMAEATGSQPINPLIQHEMMQSGLGGAAGAFGAANLGTGTAGQARAATNLGLNVNKYIAQQQQMGEGLLGTAGAYQQGGLSQLGAAQAGKTSDVNNYATLQAGLRALAQAQMGGGQSAQNMTGTLQGMLNQQNSTAAQANQQGQALTQSELNQGFNQGQGLFGAATGAASQANTMFPHNQIGLPGSSLVNMFATNTMNQNAYNQAAYAAAVQNATLKMNQQTQQVQANQAADQSQTSSNATVGAAIAVAAACWVARSVYGWSNPKWVQFREWLLFDAPEWFRVLYLRHGRDAAKVLDQRPLLKLPVRLAMDFILMRHA